MGSTQETVGETTRAQNQEKKMAEFQQHQRRGQRLFQRTLNQREEAQVHVININGLVEELWDLLQGILASASEAIDSVVENFFGGSRSFALKVIVGVLLFLVAFATYFLYICEDDA